MRRPITILIVAFCVFNLFGCAGLKKEKTSTLESQALLKFADVPVPTGFKVMAKESYSFESSGVRVGVLKYKGKANIEQVESFYKEQMPMYNWNFLNVVEYGERLLNFDRDNETCIINLLPRGGAVIITISVGPKSRVSTKASRAALK
jgi:hypothetical protein